MDNTKIDWCDMSWNPITGCKHGCEYCYARRIATRFDGKYGERGENHGLCFPGETVNRVAYKSPLQRQKAALEAALVARGGIAPAT